MNTTIKSHIKPLALIAIVFFAVALGTFLNANIAEARAVITCDSATLEGHVSGDRDNPTTVWFEWGRTADKNSSYPYMTEKQTFTSSGNFNELIAGLEPNTSYFYRAIAQNDNGETIGETISFQTSPCGNQNNPTTVVPVYINNPPVTNTIIRETIVRENTNQNNSNTNSNNNSNNSINRNDNYEEDDSSLSANALSSGYFLPRTLLGWILLFIVLLLIIAAVKRYTLRRTVIKNHIVKAYH